MKPSQVIERGKRARCHTAPPLRDSRPCYDLRLIAGDSALKKRFPVCFDRGSVALASGGIQLFPAQLVCAAEQGCATQAAPCR
jgi:hypothetical protein